MCLVTGQQMRKTRFGGFFYVSFFRGPGKRSVIA